MPEMASRRAYAVAGRSGLPKLRQLVIAAGSAPLHATFRTACATASRPPRRGSSATRAPSPSRATATARLDGVSRTTAASPPGRSTVPDPTSWSYWAYTQALEQTFGRARSWSRSAEASRRLGDRVGAASGASARESGLRGSSGYVGASARAATGRSPTTSPAYCATRRSPGPPRPIAVHGSSWRAQTGLDVGQASRLDDRCHALLRLRDHDLERVHPGLAQRNVRELDLETYTAARGHLGERRREAGGAQILQRDHQAALGQLERALEQLLPRERIADLDRRALVLGALLVEILRGEHAGAADAVAARSSAPYSTTTLPGACAVGAHEPPGLSTPRHIALTSGLSRYAASKTVSPPTFATPTQLP